MLKQVSLKGVVGAASILGVVVPIVLLVRVLALSKHLFGTKLDLLFYPGLIFLFAFDQSRQSSLYGLALFGLSIMATVALYALAAMIAYGIACSMIGAWRFLRRRNRLPDR